MYLLKPRQFKFAQKISDIKYEPNRLQISTTLNNICSVFTPQIAINITIAASNMWTSTVNQTFYLPSLLLVLQQYPYSSVIRAEKDEIYRFPERTTITQWRQNQFQEKAEFTRITRQFRGESEKGAWLYLVTTVANNFYKETK